MKINFKKISLGVLATICLTQNVLSYDIVDRAKLIDDRFKTMEMLRPFGHNFYLDINGAVTTDAMDLKDDAEKIGKLEGTTDQQIDEANKILEKYYDKEQVLRARFGFGIPIFSFNAFDINFEPNLRVDAGLMAILTPQKETANFTTLVQQIGNIDGVPQGAVDKILNCVSGATPSDGDDLLVVCVPTYITTAERDQIKDAGIEKIPYIASIASTTKELPKIDVYAKVEAKAGLWFDYTKGEHFFGTFGLYGLGRIDVNKTANAALLLGDSAGLDVTENTLINAAVDYRFGYKNSNYSAFFSVEELKLAEMSSEDNGATPDFGTDPLIRLHGQADYKVSFFKMSPYAGIHKRSGYDLADGFYVGSDWGMHVWEDRVGLTFKTALDKEHITLGLKTKLWLMHLDLTGKFAVSDKVDDIKVSNYYGLNFRLFF
ncbi:hypothetical protein [Bacteriovorax sp. Seq25_V]|uniref:hypothetical protein n=1 Tax=Bacteriovorax sp. Seq25_V TaxID=1201288 RepID=UPI00038A1CD5|nr:hypothetical protein [Bacteriovorax sp. Seq25_V]EQC43988.1 hypothetical protein M900_1235 [Bacteriovorax sp. Seq25_V]